VARPIAAAVQEPQYFARIGQRHDQRVIAPHALICAVVDPLFALGVGGDERAVGFDPGLGEELLRLLRPDLHSRLVVSPL